MYQMSGDTSPLPVTLFQMWKKEKAETGAKLTSVEELARIKNTEY